MAVELGWFDGHDPAPLLKQELICEVGSLDKKNEFTLELQSRFVPMSESLKFEKTNFGFLAVRVAESLSAVFGDGILTGSEGTQSEKNLFEPSARWVDCSGLTNREGTQIEGIPYFDHPAKPGQPTTWHVRDDGWLCASPCMKSSLTTTKEQPLTLRYLLHIHAGGIHADRATVLHARFSSLPIMTVVKGTQPHARLQDTRRSEQE